MTIREAAPTFREPVQYDEGLKQWTFDPHWLRWLTNLTQAVGTPADHGSLTGLLDDDHPQYHNDARGDARYQPLDSDLTAIAALATTAFGRSLLTLANAAALAAAHTHTLAQVTDVTMTVADLNTLDDGVDTTLHFHAADRARGVHTGTQVAATISDFDTQVRTSRLDQMAAPTASVSFNGQQATNFRIENRTSDPGSPTTGQIWLRTDL